MTKEETLVFGDYHNDIEMMQEADFSFAMKNAHSDIKKLANYSTESYSFAMKNAHRDIKAIANYTTESNNNFGVERVLEKLVQVHS